MKKMIYLLILAFLPSSIIHADHGHKNLEGRWFARNSNKDLRIKSRSNGIKVQGLNGHWGWRKMQHSRIHNVFKDAYGNRIEVINRNHIVHTVKIGRSRRHVKTRVTHYVRGRERRGNICNDEIYYDGRSRDGGYSEEYRYRGNDYNDDYRGDDDYRNRMERRDRENMVGSWVSRDVDRIVHIKQDGDGIKARFGGSSKWTFYYQDRDESSIFTDRQGNRYRIMSQNNIKWTSFDGRSINLTRE